MTITKSPVSFGTIMLGSLPPWKKEHQVVSEAMEHIVAADRHGFDVAWVAEHNARHYGIFSSAHTVLAAAAGATRRIRLGSAVTRLPLHHPLKLAEELSLVDQLSAGRLIWGIGKGYDDLEFSSYGFNVKERDERYQEGLSIVIDAWTRQNVRVKGKYWTIPLSEDYGAIELYPKPFQQPHPPIYVMTSSDESVAVAGSRGFSFVLGQNPQIASVRRKVDVYVEAASRAGFSDEQIKMKLAQSGQVKNIHLASTKARAEKEYEEALMWFMDVKQNRRMFGFSVDPKPYTYYTSHENIILGDSTHVSERLEEFFSVSGLGHVVCWFDCGGQPHENVLRSIEQFSAEVMPALAGSAVA